MRWATPGQLALDGHSEATADPTTISGASCPPGTDVLVLTARGTASVDVPFYITIFA